MPSWNTGQYQYLWPLPAPRRTDGDRQRGRGCSSDTGGSKAMRRGDRHVFLLYIFNIFYNYNNDINKIS